MKDTERSSIDIYNPDFTGGYRAYFGNVLISSCRDLTVFEERYLTLLVAKAAEQLRKYKHLNGLKFEPDEVLCPRYIRFSPKELLNNSKNYEKARKAAEEMASKVISFTLEKTDGSKVTRIVHLTGPVDIKGQDEMKKGKNDDPYILLRVEKELWELILDMSAGYSIIDIKYIFRLKRPVSMRLLPLFFNITKNPLKKRTIPDYKIETLRKMFGKENEYRDNAAFVSRVINPAIEEIKALDAPFYGEAELIRNDKTGKIEKIHFIPQINFSKFEAAFPCLLPGSKAFRSKDLTKVFAFKYGWTKIPVQVANIINFAQEYIEDDALLCNIVSDLRSKILTSEIGEVGGFISLMKSHLLKNYNAEYIAPSYGGVQSPKRHEGETYTDWQLLKYQNLNLNPYEEVRLKALLEAQKEHYTEDFMKVKAAADKIMAETELPKEDRTRFIYGIEHLSDEQLYKNVVAGIITDDNVESYDEDSRKRLEFIVKLIFARDKEKYPTITFEDVKKLMAIHYYHSDSIEVNELSHLRFSLVDFNGEEPYVVNPVDDCPTPPDNENIEPFDELTLSKLLEEQDNIARSNQKDEPVDEDTLRAFFEDLAS